MRIFENGLGRNYEISLELVDNGDEMLYAYDRVEDSGNILIYPRDVQWLNGADFILGLRDADVNNGLFVTNRPTDKTNGSLHTEVISYDHESSAPLSNRQEYGLITPSGELELIVGGVQRVVRLRLTSTLNVDAQSTCTDSSADMLADVLALRPEPVIEQSDQIAA